MPILIILLVVFLVLFIRENRQNRALKKERNQWSQMYTEQYNICQEKFIQLREVEEKLKNLGAERYDEVTSKVNELNIEIAEKRDTLLTLENEYVTVNEKLRKSEKQAVASERKLNKVRELYNAVVYAVEKYTNLPEDYVAVPPISESDLAEFMPSIELHIQCMDTRDLLKAFKENDKRINEVTERYRTRYTTKTNQTIYALMVIALRAELQNILYDLKIQKLETGIENVKTVTEKYLALACDGNQSIAPTMTKFIGEIEYLFTNAVKIEYSYYVRKEQARQEQLAIREQMKQEAAERKALEAERKKIESEEIKFKNQISEIQEKLENADVSDREILEKRILELEGQLTAVAQKKDEIVNLQNGKAGNVYIISNLGSFGDSMFKIGMTRRLDPQERIDELGSASVPFEFDVHSFIFSEDAVGLENELHRRLHDKRVNKVNTRKEFFYSTLEELEALTNEISPTAIFNRTMAAEEYRQSLSTDKVLDNIDSDEDSNYTTDDDL